MIVAVVSELPGRVRWSVPGLRDRAELAAGLEQALAELATVRRAQANPLTGRLLVLFDERVSTVEMQTVVLEKLRAHFVATGTGSTALRPAPGVEFGGGAVGTAGLGLSPGPRLGVAVGALVLGYLVSGGRRLSTAAGAAAGGASPLLLQELARCRTQVLRATALSGAGALALLVHYLSAGLALDVVVTGSTRILGIGLAGTSGAVVLVSVGVIAAVLRAWARHRSQVIFGDAARAIQATLRDRLAKHVLSLEVVEIDDHRRRELQALLTSDVNQVGSAFDSVWELGDVTVTSTALLGGVFFLSRTAGVIALLPIPGMIALSLRFAPRMQAAYARLREEVVEIGGEVTDTLEGFETIKGFTDEAGQFDRLRQASASYRQSSSVAMRELVKFPLALDATVFGVLIAMTAANGRLVRRSRVSFGGFNALALLTTHLVFPVVLIGPHANAIAAGQSSYSQIQAALDAPVGSDEHLPELPAQGARGEVVFRDVVFAYPGAETLFDGLSLRFPAGKTTAVVGFSGSGKSTVIRLLLRFRDPDSGTIEVDGYDIAKLRRRSVRQAISVASQDMRLLHGSVEDNIRLGDPGGDRAVVEHFARLAEAHGFIVELPDGYETVLGRDGTRLSGGERQRIAIARALMKPARILVFDEATSNVDSRTEMLIRDNLASSPERTLILIAHRLSIVRDADHIYFLDRGEVVEQGTHDELVARNGKYRMLWELQRSEDSV